jgi:hypothetical protein
LKLSGKPETGVKKILLAVALSFCAFSIAPAGGRQDKDLLQYLADFESQLYMGKDVGELWVNPDLTGFEAGARGVSAAPQMDFTHTDMYGNPYKLTFNYRIANDRVDAVRIYCRSGNTDDITALYFDACLFLEYYGAYNEYLSKDGQQVFNGNRHGGRIQVGNNAIYLTLDDKDRRYFPSRESIKIN